MSDETTKTMRDLLERWAAMEPDRCKPVENDYFKISFDANTWHLVYPGNLSAPDLSWIQYAVQAAIVSRGWSFWIGHDSHYGFGYEAEINADLAQDINAQGHTSAAEVLLTAYLRALEEAK